jgi:hypothetical protein
VLLCRAPCIVHKEGTGTGVAVLVETAFVADLETSELNAEGHKDIHTIFRGLSFDFLHPGD